MNTDHIAFLINALPLPVVVIGSDDRIHAINQPAERIFGPELVGRHHVSVVRQPQLIAAIGEARTSGEPRLTRFINRDGDKDIRYRVTVATADAFIVATFEDQTASEEAGQMRRDFVANVSHELRTPLTALLGFIETLNGAARDDPEARSRFLEIMAGEANRMTRLVDDLLSLSRVEEDERVRPKEHVDLAALLTSVINGLGPQAEAADVNVALKIESSDAMITGDAGQLVQVFANIIENAIKYGANGNEVIVTLMGQGPDTQLRTEAVQISVEDQGDGIAPHHIARLTERFYRVDNHRSRQVGGTGLGLAIVKHIVSRHRGRLKIESEEGKGTKITVFLPTS